LGDIKGEVREDSETGERHLSHVAVAARDLRTWTPDDREAFARLRAAVVDNTPEAASLHITERMLADDRIEEIEVDDETVRVNYRARMKLFGFIPLEREVEARMGSESAEPEMTLPWWSFLATKPDREQIATTLRDTLNILVSARVQ
jgi:hypothetical protein